MNTALRGDMENIRKNYAPAFFAESFAWLRPQTYALALIFGFSMLLLSACSTLPQKSTTVEVVESSDEAIEEDDLPSLPLTEVLLADLLTAEIAAQRGQTDIALEAFTRSAFDTRDPRLVARATRWSLHSQRYTDALDLSRLWLELRPDDVAANQAMAQTLVALSRTDELARHLEKMIASATNIDASGAIFVRIAEMMARHENTEQFIPVMDELVANYPDIAEAHFAQALLASRLQQPEQVEQSLAATLVRKPDWEEAAIARIGNLSQLERDDFLDEVATTFLRKNPKADKFRIQYARILLDRDEWDEALKQYQKVIRNDPENADAHYAAGLLQIERENWQEALTRLERHLELRPNHDQTRIYLGQVNVELEAYDEAIRWYREVSSHEASFDAKLRIAGVMVKRDGLDAAIEYLNGLVTRDEAQRVKVLLAQEQIYRDEKRLQDAKDVLNRALNEFPENGDLLYARALVAAQLNEIQQHETDMRLLIEQEPDNAHAYNALGYTLADQTDRYDEAFDLVNKALELRPDDPFILDSMGWVHYRMGRHDEAMDYLQRAFSLREDAEIAAHLGELFWVKGDKEQARAIWERGLELTPDNDVLLGTIQRLDP